MKQMNRRDVMKTGMAMAALGAASNVDWVLPALALGETVVPFTEFPPTFNPAPAVDRRLFDTRTLSGPFTPKDHQVAATLSSYWVNFATNGDPNGKGQPAWPAVSTDKAQTMEVGAEFRPIPIAGSPARVDFFRRVLAAR